MKMDQSILLSETLETLYYLLPPVKKTHKRYYQESSTWKEVKPFLAKKSKKRKYNHNRESNKVIEQSSTVNLQSVQKKFIHQKHSLLNLRDSNLSNHKTEKPITQTGEKKTLIKIFVKPKFAETEVANLDRKPQVGIKKIQSTDSIPKYHVDCMHLLNKKNQPNKKINEIKVTESDKLTNKKYNSKYEDISLEQITNCKKLLRTINMENKNVKHKRKKSPQRCSYNGDNNANETTNKIKDPIRNPNDTTSKVKVFGKLGQQANKDYVLHCAATINDNPIAVVNGLTNSLPCYWTQGSNIHSRDQMAQTNFRCSNMACMSRFENAEYSKSITSQATQVNLNVGNQNQALRKTNLDALPKTPAVTAYTLLNDNNIITDTGVVPPEEYKSPLVIISVYPRQDTLNQKTSNANIYNKKSPPRIKTKSPTQTPKSLNKIHKSKEKLAQTEKHKKITTNENNSIKIARSRSPSPARNFNKFVRKAVSSSKSKFNEQEKQLSMKLHTPKTKGSENCHCQFAETNIQSNRNNKATKKDMNLNPQEVKRALVDNFLKDIGMNDNYFNYYLHVPKENASKVTININDQKNQYDLVLEQRDQNTDLIVRKKNKDKLSQEKKTEEIDAIPLNTIQNYLMLSSSQNSTEMPYVKENTMNAKEIHTTVQRQTNLNLRDSLEISRRCEIKVAQKEEHRDRKSNNFETETKGSPIKHSRGDNCPIPDPNERDKEIRELLGIMQQEKRNKTKIDISINRAETEKHHLRSKNFMDDVKIEKNTAPRVETIKPTFKSQTKSMGYRRKSNNKRIRKNMGNCDNILKGFEFLAKNHSYCNMSNLKQNKLFKRSIKFGHNVTPNNACDICALTDRNFTQNLLLNRNLKVYFEVEQCNQKKPKKLIKAQNNKFKKVIKTRSIKTQAKHNPDSVECCNIVSVGNVKIKTKAKHSKYHNTETQTEDIDVDRFKNKINVCNKKKTVYKVHKTSEKSVDAFVVPCISDHVEKERVAMSKPTVSSMEIRFANFPYLNNMSHLDCKQNDSKISLQAKNSKSILTIFKGRKRPITPNLGTSAYSLCSQSDNISVSTNSYKVVNKGKETIRKKPFLRRLITCLVMRSNPVSNTKLGTSQKAPKVTSVNSSMNSYHFSTSLGAFEMSSALYDTTASFYSNHTILEVNKVKQGFLRSVRGFLTNLR